MLALLLSLLATANTVSAIRQGGRPLLRRQDGPTDPGIHKLCTFWDTAVDSSATCDYFETTWSITHEDFVFWNPSVKDDCSGIVVGHSYCVEVNYGVPLPSSTTTTTTTTSALPTTTGNGIATPSPTQPEMVDNCNKFYFVKKGDNCADIASKSGISAADFMLWNPKVGSQCAGLWADTYACVGVIGGTTTTAATTTTSTTTAPPTPAQPTKNNIPTPQPTQPGMVGNCVKFHYISKGNTCDQITSYNGISMQDFITWNPQIGQQCTGMWADAYACVGIAAFSLKSRYHQGCSGDVYNNVAIKMGQDYCMNTDCRVGSLEIDVGGLCPNGEVQLSYWEQPGCTGKWFGYGYADKGTCRGLWTNGSKFKAIHMRCAKQADDCSSKGTCSYDPEPEHNSC